MSLRVVEGSTLEINEKFVDDFNDPYIPAEGQAGPEVKILDVRGDRPELVLSKYASPDPSEPGNWQVALGVPVLDLTELTDFNVVWSLIDEDHNTHRIKHVLQVEPSSQNRVTDIVLLVKDRNNKLNFSLPFPYDPLDYEVKIDFFKGNKPLIDDLDIEDASVNIRKGRELTRVQLPAVVDKSTFEPHTLIVHVTELTQGIESSLTYKVWCVTPQVMVAASMVEDHINKARLENVIPELEYTQQDLILYLYRGLQLFNGLLPRLTAFNGMNMQGIILNAWVTCSSYYALSAQLQAEGSMAYDFSGQSVSFNVDRSPSIEAALGRIESQIDQNVKPVKVLLGKAGIVSGDGSQGSKYISGAQNFGMLGVTQSPTTIHSLRLRTPRVRRV